MDVRKFVLSYYRTATKDFYITRITHPTEATKLHSHEYFQAYYVQQGHLVHHIDNASALLTAGDVFILPPDIPHYIEADGDGLAFYAMSFMPAYFAGVREGSKLVADFLQYLKSATEQRIQPKLTLPTDDVLFVDAVFKRVLSEFEGKKSGKEDLIHGYATVLISLFARIYFEQKVESLNTEFNRQSVMYCIEYVKNHSDENISLDGIARRCAMSRTTFCTLFSALTGTTFRKYLHACRIERAMQMIQSGEKITAVSERCGYGDFSTFHRNFKAVSGMSPKQYLETCAIHRTDEILLPEIKLPISKEDL